MLTAEDYRQSIRDGRASYLEGRRIEDPVTHPLLRVSVDWVASTYEQTCSAGPGTRNPIFDQPATPAELDEQIESLEDVLFDPKPRSRELQRRSFEMRKSLVVVALAGL